MIYDFRNYVKVYEAKSLINNYDIDLITKKIKKIRDVLEENEISNKEKLRRISDVTRSDIDALISIELLKKDESDNFYLDMKRDLPPKRVIEKAAREVKRMNKRKEERKQETRKENIRNLLHKIYKKLSLSKYMMKSEKFKEFVKKQEGNFNDFFIDKLTELTPLSEDRVIVNKKPGYYFHWPKDAEQPNEKMVNKILKNIKYNKQEDKIQQYSRKMSEEEKRRDEDEGFNL